MMNQKCALGVLTVLCSGISFGCEKSQTEREQEAMEERQDQREDFRERTEEARYEEAPRSETTNVNPGTNTNPEGPATGTVRATKGLEAATVKQIAQARCAREQKCGNIGADQEYASSEACQQKITADWAEEVNAYECAGGVVQKELDECLTEIQNEDCASPFDTLGRVVACRSSDICKAAD